MKASTALYKGVPGPEIQMIRVSQDHRGVQEFQPFVRHGLDRTGRPDGHEYRCGNLSVRGPDPTEPSGSVPVLVKNFEAERVRCPGVNHGTKLPQQTLVTTRLMILRGRSLGISQSRPPRRNSPRRSRFTGIVAL